MFFNAFKNLFASKTTNKLSKKGISRRLELLGLEERITPSNSPIIVDTDLDLVDPTDNLTSLREAIDTANSTAGNDTIDFNFVGGIPFPYIITLGSALPNILDATATITGGTVGTLTINGLGSSDLTISGNNGVSSRDFNIFNIDTGGDLTISGVTVSGAQTSGNGGAFNNAGTLTVSNSSISGNTTSGSGGGIFNNGTFTLTSSTLYNNSAQNGGGITNIGTLTVTNSTLSTNNAASGFGGGILNTSIGTLTVSNSTFSDNTSFNGGGILNTGSGTGTVTNSTFSGNSAANNGGGIFNDSTLTVTNSTLSGNSATSGGGIFNDNAGVINIANTIITNSTGTVNVYDGSGTVNLITGSTAANNLVSQGTFSWATTKTSAEINLGPLQNNGGPTFTIALGSNSAALGNGSATISNAPPVSGTDQRGFSRINSDIGAYAVSNVIKVTTTADTVDPSDNLTSLREAIDIANNSPGNDIINFNFSSGSSPYTITLDSELPSILDAAVNLSGSASGTTRGNLTITGLGLSALTISGDNGDNTRDFRIFNIDTGGNLSVSGVTVSGAQSVSDGGGFYVNAGTLNISDSLITGNSAAAFGGGIASYLTATINISNSTISNNSVPFGGGGGIFSYGGTLTISSSTISGNTAGRGAGIQNALATLNISNSTISGNIVVNGGKGGGIANYGPMTISNSTISGNTARIGGAIYNDGITTVSNSTLSGNTASYSGGAIYNGGTITVSNSTIDSNSAVYGGGILNSDNSTLTITNSTIFGNSATTSNGAGGAILSGKSTLNVSSSTISGNSAAFTGGIYFSSSKGTFNLANTIIADNTGGDFSGGPSPTTSTNNLITSGSLTGATTVTSQQLNLGPLQNNGGPTQTLALLTGSVAIGTGSATISNAPPIYGLDQRSYVRSSTAPSIGAYEFNGIAPSPENNFSFDPITGAITTYTGPGGAVIIPSTIGGVPVLAIGANAFANNTNVTSVVIPYSVTSIGQAAFDSCTNLVSVTLPQNLTSFGNSAFAFCTSLTSITIPSGVTTLPAFLFDTCSQLAYVSIPSSVASINNAAFRNCFALNSLYFYGNAPTIADNTVFTDVPGTIYYLQGATGWTDPFSANNIPTVAVSTPTVTQNTGGLATNATTLTITGTNFVSTPSLNTVTFNNGAVGNVTSATATQLIVNLTTPPTTIGSLTAVVTSFGGTSGSAVQVANIVAAPTVTSISPTSGSVAGGTSITITGTGFTGATLSPSVALLLPILL